VNPEQASKVKSRTPTHLRSGEGRSVPEKRPSSATGAVRRGSGSGMHEGMCGQRGRSGAVRGRSPQRFLRKRRHRKSDGLVVPQRPRNGGGGKEPNFWDASDEAKDRGVA
jgi:hypothetical protein